MGFQDYWKQARGYCQDSFSNNYRSVMLKWRKTRFQQNIDTMFVYRDIYENLTNAGLPVMKGTA